MRVQLVAAMATAVAVATVSDSIVTASAKLTPNELGFPTELSSISEVCANRSSTCSVLLDVPEACAGVSSDCPVAIFFHGHGGSNKGFPHSGAGQGVHKHGFIGIYPQGEIYNGRSGWNDGSMDGNTCDWNDFSCQDDPNDGLFAAAIIAEAKQLGAKGNIYLWGGSNGANEAQILAANACDDLPIAGISAGWGQLLCVPVFPACGERGSEGGRGRRSQRLRARVTHLHHHHALHTGLLQSAPGRRLMIGISLRREIMHRDRVTDGLLRSRRITEPTTRSSHTKAVLALARMYGT